jgi:hypothetical protein
VSELVVVAAEEKFRHCQNFFVLDSEGISPTFGFVIRANAGIDPECVEG